MVLFNPNRSVVFYSCWCLSGLVPFPFVAHSPCAHVLFVVSSHGPIGRKKADGRKAFMVLPPIGLVMFSLVAIISSGLPF